MTSKLETRIATQKYHGISNAAWWKLTDEEQEALIREADHAAEWLQNFNQRTEGITHISSGSALQQCSECSDHHDYEDGIAYTEPYFSWSACDTCGSTLGGDREDAHGWYDGSLIHLAICTDCVVYIANGELPST